MSKVLVKSSFDYADEFDVPGFAIMEKEAYQDGLLTVSRYFAKFNSFSLYFGTNEEISFTSERDLISQLDVSELTDVQAEVISSAIGHIYGLIDFIDILWRMEDELERFEEDEDEEGEE